MYRCGKGQTWRVRPGDAGWPVVPGLPFSRGRLQGVASLFWARGQQAGTGGSWAWRILYQQNLWLGSPEDPMNGHLYSYRDLQYLTVCVCVCFLQYVQRTQSTVDRPNLQHWALLRLTLLNTYAVDSRQLRPHVCVTLGHHEVHPVNHKRSSCWDMKLQIKSCVVPDAGVGSIVSTCRNSRLLRQQILHWRSRQLLNTNSMMLTLNLKVTGETNNIRGTRSNNDATIQLIIVLICIDGVSVLIRIALWLQTKSRYYWWTHGHYHSHCIIMLIVYAFVKILPMHSARGALSWCYFEI